MDSVLTRFEYRYGRIAFLITLSLHAILISFSNEKVAFTAPLLLSSPTTSLSLKIMASPNDRPKKILGQRKKKATPKKVTNDKLEPKKSSTISKQNTAPVEKRAIISLDQPQNFKSNIVNYVSPSYPRIAERRAWTGKVKLLIEVDQQGRAFPAIVSSSGYDALDGAALKAVSQWSFRPVEMGKVSQIRRFYKNIEFVLNL